MSIYYSSFALNTYYGTPYAQSVLPESYPILKVMLGCRSFRRLPDNLRELAKLAKQWAKTHRPEMVEELKQWYDDEGYELDPRDGHRLSHVEIDAQWGPADPSLKGFVIEDIEIPPGGFPDPLTWEPPERDEKVTYEPGPSQEQIQRDVNSHGREAVSEEYGIPIDQLPEREPSEYDGVVIGVATGKKFRRQKG